MKYFSRWCLCLRAHTKLPVFADDKKGLYCPDAYIDATLAERVVRREIKLTGHQAQHVAPILG